MKAGDKVTYTPTGEKGIVKSVPRNNGLAFPFVFVVFNCGGDWENWQDYTGVYAAAEKLTPGWA